MKPWKRKLQEGEPIIVEPLANQRLPTCPFCQRTDAGDIVLPIDRHHLVPVSLGGEDTLDCCVDCHKAIHALLPHKELRRFFHTVERLMSHPPFREMVTWITKQHVGSRVHVVRPSDQRFRSRFR